MQLAALLCLLLQMFPVGSVRNPSSSRPLHKTSEPSVKHNSTNNSNCGPVGPSQNCKGFVCTCLTSEEKDFILDFHNSKRNELAGGEILDLPPVPNMMQLVWDETSAAQLRKTLVKCKHHYGKSIKYKVRNIGKARFDLMNQGAMPPTKNRYLIWQILMTYWLAALEFLPGVFNNVSKRFAYSDAASILGPTMRNVGCAMSEEFYDNSDNYYFQCTYYPHKRALVGKPFYLTGPPRSKCPKTATLKQGDKNATKEGGRYPNLCEA